MDALHVLSEDNPPAAALFAANPPMLNAVQDIATGTTGAPPLISAIWVEDVATGTTGAPPLLAALALGTLSNLGVQPRGGFGAILSSVEAALGPELMARAPEVLSNVEKGGDAVLSNVEKGGDAAQRQVDVSVMEEAEEEKGGGPIGHHKFEEQFMHTEGAAAAPHVAHSEWTQEVIVSQVVLQMLANMMVSDEAEEEDAGGDDEGWMTDEEGEGDMEDEGPAGGEAAAAAAWLADSKVVWRIAALSTFPPQELLDSLAQSPARDAPDMAHKLAERQEPPSYDF
ncbi:hypothetical protein T484DRAFT_1762170 [Baffinella frigidus]|nr:hypothetical protein T484DRAFT_1762170 [Cryptophyta sp. CCMP2293]